MELKVKRTDVNDARTIGVLIVNDFNTCYTLERAPHDPVHRSIPEGRYRISLYESPHWKQQGYPHVPLLHDVPGRSFIEMHPANYVEQLEGCIAVGNIRSENGIAQSRMIFNPLLKRIEAAIARDEEVWITIVDPRKEETVPDVPPANVAA